MAVPLPVSRTLPAVLIEKARTQAAHPAVIADGVHTSYADLAVRSHQVARALLALGVQPGDRVGVLMSNQVEWIEICLGTQIVGATLVPISTWSKQREIAFILADAAVRTLFAVASFGKEDFLASVAMLAAEAGWQVQDCVLVGVAPGEIPHPWLAYEALLGDASASSSIPGAAQAQDDALILYTSGSTSTPKAVRLAHYGLVENGYQIGARMGLNAEDRVLVSVPLFWAYGSANALPAILTHGATIVLQDRFEPAGALALIEQYRCTAIYTLPTMTAAMLAEPGFASTRTSSLRTGLTTGTPQDIISAAVELGAAQICNIYGSSETYGNCCVTPGDWPLERRSACQGPPLPGVSLRIVDAVSNEPVASGERGLIEVTGYLMRGYGGSSAALNNAVFTPDGWYRTGDIGYLTETGEIVFCGRHSEMIKRAGINVSPAEVEDILMQHADVAQVGVVGVPDLRRGEIIVATVVAGVGTAPTEAALLAHCRAIASTYKVPDHVLFRASLPMTVTGKLMRNELKSNALAALATDLQERNHDA